MKEEKERQRMKNELQIKKFIRGRNPTKSGKAQVILKEGRGARDAIHCFGGRNEAFRADEGCASVSGEM